MKIPPADLARLRAAIEPLDTPSRRAIYREGKFPRASAVKDLDRRYRWDLFWCAGGMELIAGPVYADAHIDTALRRVIATL